MAEVNGVEKQTVTQEYLKKMDAYWRAANYLGAAQLYLLDNPLLREPLTMDHIKKKIVGHWGTVLFYLSASGDDRLQIPYVLIRILFPEKRRYPDLRRA